MIAHARHLVAVVTWRPLAATATATAAGLALIEGPRPILLAVAAAAVAAATPFVLDDAAAATLEASPTTLRRRHARRVAIVLPLLAAWWVFALVVVSGRNRGLSAGAYTLQLATLVGIGLAVASVTSATGSDRTRGGSLGALAVIVCFGSAFLPFPALQIVPADPARPDAGRHLIVVLVVAIAVQVAGSADPARRSGLRAVARNARGPLRLRGKGL